MEKGLFSRRVYEVVRRIPKGKVATYGQVAALAGAPRNARFVGYALHSNPEPGVIHVIVWCSETARWHPDSRSAVRKDSGFCSKRKALSSSLRKVCPN